MLLSVNLARLPFSAFCGGFPCAGVVRCASTICLVCAFCGGFCGFPRLAFCSRRCGRFCFHLSRFPAFCRLSLRWRLLVSVLPSVMILSRLAHFDRFRLARLPSVFARFRLFRPSVVVCYPLRLSVRSRAFFGFVSAVRLYLSSYNRRCAAVNLSHNAHFCLISRFCCACGVICLKMVTSRFWGVLGVLLCVHLSRCWKICRRDSNAEKKRLFS